MPRLPLGYPTPVEEMPRLREALGPGCPRLLVKRDDLTGAGMGGNKVRKLEYEIAAARAAGSDTLITCGGIRSNHCRITAALAARLGYKCHLVMNTPAGAPENTASLWLDRLYGAEIHRVADRAERSLRMAELAAAIREGGGRPYVIPLGASTPRGALGFARAVFELRDQLDAAPEWIFHCTSSGGTQAGLEAGLQLAGWTATRLVGISADDPAEAIARQVSALRRGIGEILETPLEERELLVDDSLVGEGYGLPGPGRDEAIELAARREGLLLDPVYTGKGMAGLLAWIRSGRLAESGTALFWHTGGQMGFFTV
jgi:1-aminocyclopropane-1-carboxylate deaminase/D-cysteine desulfhydrase-like pyridoxal-dependent ACC family enzyme